MQTWCHSKVNGNSTYEKYFHGASNGHAHFSLPLSLSLYIRLATIPQGQSPWLYFPISVLDSFLLGVCPSMSETCGYAVKRGPTGSWQTYLLLGESSRKCSLFLMLPWLVLHDRRLHCEIAVWRADGRSLLLVRRDSFLTKEVLFSPVFILYIADIFCSFFPFIYFFSWTVYMALASASWHFAHWSVLDQN